MLVERKGEEGERGERGETKTFKKSWNSETCLTTRRASPVVCNIYIYIYNVVQLQQQEAQILQQQLRENIERKRRRERGGEWMYIVSILDNYNTLCSRLQTHS